MRCFSAGRSVTTRCRNSAVSSSRRSGEFHALDHDAARHGVQPRVLLLGQFPAGEDHHRNIGQRVVFAHALEHLEAGHVRQPQIEHHAVARLLAQDRERILPGVGIEDFDVVMAEQLGDAHLLGLVVLHHQQAAAARLREFLDLGRARRQCLRGVAGLLTKANAPRASPCWRSSSSVMICTGIWRVSGFCLS